MANLLVYLHLAMKQRALESSLQNELPGVEVTAVGRVADFDRALAQGQDAVLSLPLVLSSRGLQVGLQGHRQGAPDESYVLAAPEQAPVIASVTSVGALDLLGREGTNRFARDAVGTNVRVERVTKVEDLLPLLQMQRVDCILLPARLLSDLQSMSRMNLKMTTLANRVRLPGVAAATGNGKAAMTQLRGLSSGVMRALGVDEWR